jgi:hypothetical protein
LESWCSFGREFYDLPSISIHSQAEATMKQWLERGFKIKLQPWQIQNPVNASQCELESSHKKRLRFTKQSSLMS